MKSPGELALIQRELRVEILRKDFTQRDVERALGMGKGYLSQLLNGNLDLKLKHVLAVLELIKVQPGTFFQRALGGAMDTVGERKVIDEARLYPESSGGLETQYDVAEPTTPYLTEAQVARMIDQRLGSKSTSSVPMRKESPAASRASKR